MESNISLLEVAGEGDFLLQQIPEDDLLNLDKDTDGIAAGNSGFFLCSPLLTDRSNGTIAGSSTASSTDYTDKENINANNLEVPKLSIMPQQMKKKKKGGGYNLRKSLAWNKAFFTEEGVLDSVELSMITGGTRTSCGEALAAIDEEIPAMPGGGCYNDLSSQDKLFTDASNSTPSANRKNGRCLMPKRGSTTKDNVKSKELSAKDASRSGSKRGSCPRPVASSSTKRPPTTSTATKPVNKEERISRIPVPKHDPTVTSRTPRKAAIHASNAKNGQVAQRGVGVLNNPKKTTLKGSSINTKSALNKDVNANKSLKAKAPIQQPRRKLASPVLKMSSSHLQKESTGSNEGLKAASSSLISKFLPLNDDGTRKVSAAITQNAAPTGGSMLSQTQMPKPSGLRMPSPSMGFFGQKKVSSFQSLPPATSETHDLSKSKIPNVRTVGPSNSLCQLATLVPKNFVKASNGEASGETNVVSSLSSGNSVEPLSHDRAKSISEAANIHSGKVNVVGASAMNKDLSAHRLEKPDVLSLSNPVLQHFEDVSRIHDEINVQLAECKPRHVSFNNFGESTKSHLGEKNDLSSQGMPRALSDLSNGAQDCNEQYSEQVEFPSSPNCIFERISSDHQRSGNGSSNSLKRSRSSIDFEHSNFEENIGNDSLLGKESCAFEKDTNEGYDDTLGTRKMRILRTKEAEASGIGHCISNECKHTLQSTSAWSNSDSTHIDDEKLTIPMSNGKSLQGKDSSESSLTSQHNFPSHENEALAGGNNGVGENNLKTEIDLCLIPHSTADACLDCGPAVRNCNDHTDEMVDISSDIEQNNTDLEMQIRIKLDQVQNEDQQTSHVQSSVNDSNQLPELAELQNRCTDLVDVSQNNHQGKCSNDDSQEDKDEIVTNSVIDSSDARTSECRSNYNQVASPKDYSSLHEKTNEIEASVRSSMYSTANSSVYDKIPREDASETMSKEITSEPRITCDDSSLCSPTEDLGSSVPNDHISSRENVQQYMETEKIGTILFQNENEVNSEMEHLLDTETCSTHDDNAESMQLRKSEDVRKQNAVGIKTSTNAVPFSEEWLAAIESAGEEILTMKTGAVQNSPPDKSQPEPGPWSPVKRKNNQGIGPFDCTKCTNHMPTE